MIDIKVDECLWAGSMAPGGILLAWAAPDGGLVKRGARLADVMIEGAQHEIVAPASGRLHHQVEVQFVLGPGDVIGRIDRP
jgi:pyruvate/2-oxoglutarate dehydrogenase complex dihydrolipoamide acyltransferase (E2) component